MSALYIILTKFENPDCCSIDSAGYKAYPFVMYLMNLGALPLVDCVCDIDNLSKTFWIIPIDIIAVSVLAFGVFMYVQFGGKKKREESPS